MEKILKYAGLVALIIAIVLSFKVFSSSQSFGGTTNFDALTLDSGNLTLTNGSIISSGDATISGGTLNITTANTATSTLVAGCWEFYATSTATALKFQASTTPGVMYSQYGACPRL